MDKIKSVIKPAGYTIRGNVYKTLLALGNELGFNCNYNDMQFNIYDKRCSDMKTYGIILTPENSNTPERQSDKFKTTSKVVQKKSKEKGLPKITHYNITRIKQGFKIETMLLPFLQVGSTCYLDFDLADARGSKYIYKIEHKGSNTGTDCTTTIYCA